MRIAVYGAGGIGGYFGGRLAHNGVDVSLIARGAQLDALRSRGLTVQSPRGNFEVELPATEDPEEIGRVDLVLMCVKSQDTAAACDRIGPLIGDDTAVLSLQNGTGNEEIIASVVGAERVMGGVAYIVATVAEPGIIHHIGGPASVIFGEMDGTQSLRAISVQEAFEAAGIDATLVSDVRHAIWDKFAFICAMSGMTASVGLPIGEIRSVPESWALFRRVLLEVASVARAEGVLIDQETIERQLRLALSFEPEVFSSLHHDLISGKPMELEALQGELVRRAGAHGIPVPATETIYAVLRPWAVRNEP